MEINMNKKALLEYALFARKELETQITLSLNEIGIYDNKIARANIVGEYTIIEGIQQSFPKRLYGLRERMIDSHFKDEKFSSVVEEFAYTWFNRIIAIRFMEVHDYFPHGFRVLTSRDGSYEPEILKNIPYVKDELHLDMSICKTLQEQDKTKDLYRYVLFQQCKALEKIIPMMFGDQEDYLELLLPKNLLSQDSIIRKITDIPDEDFLNDVEVVGWLYQFYNSVKKDEVFASKETITKDTLPAVTQLFTPDWIVRFMCENSIGRAWLESNPNSPLRNEMKYYVPYPNEYDKNSNLDSVKYKSLNVEELKIIEPCCGSGHILVYAFDLLYKMYVEKGYNSKDIPGLILKNNLVGLDVDKRAAQLAQFSLLMKARSIDNRFFYSDREVVPHIFEITDSSGLIEDDYLNNLKSFKFSEESLQMAEYLVTSFQNGKTIGSLLKIKKLNYLHLISEINEKENNEIPNVLQQHFWNYGLVDLKNLAIIGDILSSKYDVMITNPPYIGIATMEKPVKDYALKNYPDSKTDMFAMFMETDLVKKNGFLAMINMHSWMFLSSFEKLRKNILNLKEIVVMAHLGAHAFETIGGEVVQTTTFVMRNCIYKGEGIYFRLVDSLDKEKDFLEAVSQ